jgi:alkyl sulfatase BDS1-like metallo-beta-lactamase superfamily hydrolase
LSADGYHKDTNTNIETIYEFYGDYWHGNPDVHSPTIYNKSTYSTMGELYQNTMDREKVIKEMGYNLISIWENDYIPHK